MEKKVGTVREAIGSPSMVSHHPKAQNQLRSLHFNLGMPTANEE